MASAMRALIFFVLILQLLFSSSATAALITSPPSSLLAGVFSKLGFRELAAVTAAANISIAAAAVFVNGAEVTKADLFNNGRVIIHGLQGFVSHLSDLSCEVDRQTTLVVSPAPADGIFAARRMLKTAMMQLRASGYSIVALAMRVNALSRIGPHQTDGERFSMMEAQVHVCGRDLILD
nr:fasciclin-like arabinogalactan protein 21 [Ipomoea batatas]